MNKSKNVVIVGGGIGGLTAALALLRRGIDVEVYDQSNQLKEIGAGIQISSNGSRVLFALGLEDALQSVQVRPERRVLRHWSTGETWNWFDLGDRSIERFGTPHRHAAPGRSAWPAGRCGAIAEARRRSRSTGHASPSAPHDGYADATFEDGRRRRRRLM